MKIEIYFRVREYFEQTKSIFDLLIVYRVRQLCVASGQPYTISLKNAVSREVLVIGMTFDIYFEHRPIFPEFFLVCTIFPSIALKTINLQIFNYASNADSPKILHSKKKCLKYFIYYALIISNFSKK